MKLIIAIINRDDAGAVIQNLSRNGFSSTRLSTTGGFLLAGNVTLLIGVEEERVPYAGIHGDLQDRVRYHAPSDRGQQDLRCAVQLCVL